MKRKTTCDAEEEEVDIREPLLPLQSALNPDCKTFDTAKLREVLLQRGEEWALQHETKPNVNALKFLKSRNDYGAQRWSKDDENEIMDLICHNRLVRADDYDGLASLQWRCEFDIPEHFNRCGMPIDWYALSRQRSGPKYAYPQVFSGDSVFPSQMLAACPASEFVGVYGRTLCSENESALWDMELLQERAGLDGADIDMSVPNDAILDTQTHADHESWLQKIFEYRTKLRALALDTLTPFVPIVDLRNLIASYLPGR